jgi:signal transduction histidine kinase
MSHSVAQSGKQDSAVSGSRNSRDSGKLTLATAVKPEQRTTAENQTAFYQELLHTVAQMQEDTDRRKVALAGAVHDLKTPLAVISGFVSLLMGEKLGVLTPRQLEALRDISGCCHRLEDAVSKLLFHAANDAKRQPLNFQEADLNSTLKQIRDMWTPVFEQKGVLLECPAAPEELSFSFDAQKVQQVISNLLENALRFTGAGGRVTVVGALHFWERRSERRPVNSERRIRPRGAPNAVKIVVADTGPGIAPEYQQEIFEEFFSASPPGIAPGVGLGLTIARHLVHAHEGKIWVESNPGAGAQFHIVLPFRRTSK